MVISNSTGVNATEVGIIAVSEAAVVCSLVKTLLMKFSVEMVPTVVVSGWKLKLLIEFPSQNGSTHLSPM